MNIADILVIIFVTLIMLAILFFSFIYPTIIKKNNHCSSCPINKKAKIKRVFKDYHKHNK